VRNLWEPDAFVVSWRYPEDSGGSGSVSGLDFVLDPLDDSCCLVFPRDTAFAFPASRDAAVVLRCDFKVEVSVDDIAELLVFPTDDSLLLWLSAASRRRSWSTRVRPPLPCSPFYAMFDKMSLHASKPACVQMEKDLHREFLARVN
jgi:hypothetical protein